MKSGVIILNKYMQLPSAIYQVDRLKEEFIKQNIQVDVFRNDNFCYLDENANVVNSLKKYDFCVYLDKDEYMGKLLESSGLRLFNSINSIIACDDKMLTNLYLNGSDVKIPKTYSGLLLFDKNVEVLEEDVKKVGENLGYPLVVKECFSSLGKGVRLANNLKELAKITNELKLSKRIYQEYISTSAGKDCRIIVIGGKAFSSMLRVSKTDFRSNVELGGVAEKFEPSDEFIRCAERVANALKLDYCGVDILFGKNDEPIICEVNSNAFFRAMESVSGKNVAKGYVDYILKEIYG